jgi:hypothetical protein
MTGRRTTRVRRAVLSFCVATLAGACGAVDGGDIGVEKEQTIPLRAKEASKDEITALARDYVSKEVDAEGAREIRERIRSLTHEEATYFHEEVARLNNLTGKERILFDAAFEYARARGLTVQDLTEAEHGEDLEKVFIERIGRSPHAGEGRP